MIFFEDLVRVKMSLRREVQWFLFGLTCSLLPLIWQPARQFEYEYASMTAWTMVVLASLMPGIGFHAASKYFGRPRTLSFALTALGLALPGSLAFTFRLCPCGAEGYLFWMVSQSLVAAVIAMSALALGLSHRSRRWSPLAVLVVGLIVTLAGLWFFPQKRIVSFFWGFLHGPVYDRWIPVDTGVVVARLSHALLGLSVVIYHSGGRHRKSWSKIILNIGAALWLSSFYWGSNGIGSFFIEKELANVLTVGRAEIHFERKTQRDEAMALALARDAAFHIDEISSQLAIKLSRPVKIYAYRNQHQKKLLFGGGSTDVTDVWTPTIHIESRASPHPTLRHEIVHAVASYSAWHGLGFHPNMVLTEGLAMALAPTQDPVSLDELSDGMLRAARLANIRDIWSPAGFWLESGMRSYAASGSLVRFMLRKYGAGAVMGIYGGASMEKAVGKSPDEIINGWTESIKGVLDQNKAAITEKLTRDQGVFSDLCPHTTEDLAQSRSTGLWTRLRQPMFWNLEDVLRWRKDLDPGDVEARLIMAASEIRKVMTKPDVSAVAALTWVDALASSYHWPPKVIEDVEAAMMRDDIAAVLSPGRYDGKFLEEIGAQIKIRNPGPQMVRQWEARRELMAGETGEARTAWRRYLAGWGDLPVAGEQESWILKYLRARRESVPGIEVVRIWERNIGGSVQSPEIHKQWTSMTGLALLEHRQYKDAASYFKKLADLSGGESALLAAEHGRRALYLERVGAEIRPIIK